MDEVMCNRVTNARLILSIWYAPDCVLHIVLGVFHSLTHISTHMFNLLVQSPIRRIHSSIRDQWVVTRVHAFPAVPRTEPVDWKVRGGLDL